MQVITDNEISDKETGPWSDTPPCSLIMKGEMLHFGLRLFFMIHKMQTFKIEV